MKKTMLYLLAALLLFGALSGCGSASAAKQDSGAQQAQEGDTEEAAAPAQAAGDYSPDGSVIFDRDGVRVTTAGLDVDPTSADNEPIIWLDIENTGDEAAYLGVTSGSVNGVMCDLYLINYYLEGGAYYGSDNEFQLAIPAGGGRYALGYNDPHIPGVDLAALGELELCFTLAEDEFTWPDYTSEPVTIVTGEPAAAIDIASLGTVAIDDDTMKLVFGEQDYDDFSGPMVYVYVENKTDRFICVMADAADADGSECDTFGIFYSTAAVAPGKCSAESMMFDSPIRELKGFENLTVDLRLWEADTQDGLESQEGVALDPVAVTYPPQVWGEYENGGLRLEVQPKYNDLVAVETPENDEDGTLFTVSETASLEAGGEGAGWLFSIGAVGEDRLHELLGGDMSGAYVFARDGDGNYYVCYRPTDVRYARATAEEMERDQARWAMLSQWAQSVPDKFAEKNGLEAASYGNTEVEIYLARAAWTDEAGVTLSTTEYGPVEIAGVDGAPYAAFVLQGHFMETDPGETPDGEYVALRFPDEDVQLDFFFAPGGYVRVTSGGAETLYQAGLYDDDIGYAEAMQGWYYAAAEQAGVREPDTSLDAFQGAWAEKLAGRGTVTIGKPLAPGKVRIEARWPDSAAVENTWKMTASLDADGRLAYENGVWESVEYDESGAGWTIDESWEASGYFYLSDAGELCWHDDLSENGEDSVFIRQ